jgi:hypothetical protein
MSGKAKFWTIAFVNALGLVVFALLAGSIATSAAAAVTESVLVNSRTPTATPTPSVTLLPATLDFGTIVIGQSSAPADVKLSNGSGRKLTIRGTTIGRDFKIAVSTCPSVLSAGQSCDYFISFQPQSTGNKKEKFTVTDSGGKSPLTVMLEGVGSRRAPTATPTRTPTRTPTPTPIATIVPRRSGTAPYGPLLLQDRY